MKHGKMIIKWISHKKMNLNRNRQPKQWGQKEVKLKEKEDKTTKEEEDVFCDGKGKMTRVHATPLVWHVSRMRVLVRD